MHLELSGEAIEFGRQALRALRAAGGDDLVQLAEADPATRHTTIAPVFERLGAWDLDPRRDPIESEAAAALCRSAGYWAIPYPVAERLSRPADLDADALVVVAGPEPAATIDGLDLRVVAVDPDGRRGSVIPYRAGRPRRFDTEAGEKSSAWPAASMGREPAARGGNGVAASGASVAGVAAAGARARAGAEPHGENVIGPASTGTVSDEGVVLRTDVRVGRDTAAGSGAGAGGEFAVRFGGGPGTGGEFAVRLGAGSERETGVAAVVGIIAAVDGRTPRESAFVTPIALRPLDTRGAADLALALVLPCWTLLGMLDRAMELAGNHVLVREQFGRRLADFQSVQFQLTDAEVERKGAEMLARYALWSVQTGQPGAVADALALRLAVLEAAEIVFRVAHQVHGAVGFCDETTLSWLSRHSLPLRRLPLGLTGTEDLLTRRIGARGLAGPFSDPRGA